MMDDFQKNARIRQATSNILVLASSEQQRFAVDNQDVLPQGPVQPAHGPVGPHSGQGGTICGLSSLASFLKILSSKRVCCVFRDIRDKNAVNQGFWSKTAVFSLPATKVHCFLIFWLPHLYNLLQPGIRKQQKYTSIHEYLYLAINKAKFALLLFQPSHCSRVILEYLRIPKNTKIQGWRIED